MHEAEALSIRARLIVAFGAALVLWIGIALFSLHELRLVNGAVNEIRAQWLPKQKALSIVERSATEHRLLAGRLLSLRSADEEAWLKTELHDAARRLAEWRADYSARAKSAQEAALFAAFRRNWTSYLEALETSFERYREGRYMTARRIFATEGGAAFSASRSLLVRLLDLGDRLSKETEIGAGSAYERAWIFIFSAIIVACLLTGGAIWWASSTISRPLQRVADTMRRLARGEEAEFALDRRERSEEIVVLADAARGYRDALVESRRLAREAETERERLAAAIRNMPMGLSMFDAEGRLVVCNELFQRLHGLPRELTRTGARHDEILEFLGLSERLSTWDQHWYDEKKARLIEHGEPFTISTDRHGDRLVEITYQPISTGGWVSVHEDVTATHRAQAEISFLARHDPLTGLANRLAFNESLDAALKRANQKEIAVLCLDLDRFKPVNDTYGHAVGDKLLQAVAGRLQRALRTGDAVGRLGGDEFAILQSDGAQPEAAAALAARVIEALSRHFQIEGASIDIGVSIGVALGPQHATEGSELLRCADVALYRSKAEGRGVYRIYHDGMTFDPALQSA